MQPSYGNSFVQSYLNSNIALAKLLCIKSETSAVTINNRLIQLYGQSSVDQGIPRSWKYYRNISGQYHTTDTMMTVTSLDTLEEINFTVENLTTHTATMEAYRDSTSRFFYSLVNKYPEQVILIKGILNPVDIDIAVAAKDGAILGYPSELVEEQEQTLIKDLEGFIQRHLIRWNVQAYGLVDTLYNTSYHAQLYLAILPKILNLRLLRCKTPEAHSFHIRQYLASHGGLDKYLPYMTLKQALFLYRNIQYIERNVGKSTIFELLIDRILTDRQIPIAEYSIRHLNSFDDKHYPLIRARRKAINSQYNIAEKDYVTTEQLYTKEDALVGGNARYHIAKADVDDLKFKTSPSSVIQTKDLESNMIDYSDAVPDPLESVLMRQWSYMATHGLYNVVVTFKDPKTSEFRTLYTKDALIYFNYIYLKSIGIEYNYVAPVYIEKFRLPQKPALTELLKGIDIKSTGARASAVALWNRQPQIVQCNSSKSFFTLAHTLYEESLRHWVTLGNTHDLKERGTLEGFILKLYGDKVVTPSNNGSDIETWLVVNNLPTYDYTYSQAQELLTNVFSAATGYVVDETKLLKNIQKNLIELLSHLSSYTVQFIRQINDSKIRLLNWQAARHSKELATAEAYLWVEINNRVNNTKGSINTSGFMDTTPVEFLGSECSITKNVTVKNVVAVTQEYSWTLNSDLPLSPSYLSATYPGYDPAVSAQAGFIGKELFDALSDEQKNSIKSIYN